MIIKIEDTILILAFLRESIILIIEGDIKLKNRLEYIEEEDVKLVDLEGEEGVKEKLLS
jgi:hypothetical protein